MRKAWSGIFDLNFFFLLHVLKPLVYDESDSSNTEVKEDEKRTLKEAG